MKPPSLTDLAARAKFATADLIRVASADQKRVKAELPAVVGQFQGILTALRKHEAESLAV